MSTGRIVSERTEVTDNHWFGPWSLFGVAIGLSLSAVPWLVDTWGGNAWSILPPIVGAVSLAIPGTLRQLGTGLLASALGAPVFVFGFYVLLIVTGLFL